MQISLLLTIDIDECALGTHDCSPNADCIDTTENYTCICRSGFTGDGRTCTGMIIIRSIYVCIVECVCVFVCVFVIDNTPKI